MSLMAFWHVWLPMVMRYSGVPGPEKPYLFERFRVSGVAVSAYSVHSDLMPADIVGTHILEETDSGSRRMVFQEGLCLVKSCWQMKSTERHRTQCVGGDAGTPGRIGGKRRPLPQPFFVMATQNPLEMEGTYPLQAQLDRFFYKIQVPFPNLTELVEVMHHTTGNQKQSVSAILTPEELLKCVPLFGMYTLPPKC